MLGTHTVARASPLAPANQSKCWTVRTPEPTRPGSGQIFQRVQAASRNLSKIDLLPDLGQRAPYLGQIQQAEFKRPSQFIETL